MNEEAITVAIILAFVAGAYLGVREAANAVLHNGRHWWKKSIYRAQQRLDYAEFSKQLDEIDYLDRMAEQ